MLHTHSIYLIVKRTEAVSPRFWREQFYDHLSELRSHRISPRGPALPGLHMCQPGRPRAPAGELSETSRKNIESLKAFQMIRNESISNNSNFESIRFEVGKLLRKQVQVVQQDFLKINIYIKFKSPSQSGRVSRGPLGAGTGLRCCENTTKGRTKF